MGFKQQTKNQLYANGFMVFDGFSDKEIAVAKKQLFAFVYSGEGEGEITLNGLSGERYRLRKHSLVIDAYSDSCSVLSLDEAINSFLRELSYTGELFITKVKLSSPDEDKVHSRYRRKLCITANELICEGKVEA